MLTINSIKNGIVIDHIQAGHGIRIFNYLGLNKVDFTVALIINAESEKHGKKDIIKIENEINIDFPMLGVICSNVTVNIIEDEIITKKFKPELPESIDDVIRCKNPRCITSIEGNVPHKFRLVDKAKGEFRCKYCDEAYTYQEV